MGINMTPADAFQILNLSASDLENMKKMNENSLDSYLKKIKRNSQKQWHPDKIASTNPSPEIVQRYQQNFIKIETSIQIVQSYILGESPIYSQQSNTDEDQTSYQSRKSADENVVLNHILHMQKTLKDILEEVQLNDYKYRKEKIILVQGRRLKDMLRQDIDDNIPVICVLAFINWIFVMILLGGTVGAITDDNPIALGIMNSLLLLQFFCCFLGLLPVSRYWLPNPIFAIVQSVVGGGMRIHMFIVERANSSEFFFFLTIPLILIGWFATFIKWVAIAPIYLIIGIFIGDIRLGEITDVVHYYADVPLRHINKLINENPDHLNMEHIYTLSHLYKELKDVRVA